MSIEEKTPALPPVSPLRRKLSDPELRIAFYTEQIFNTTGKLPTNEQLAVDLAPFEVTAELVDNCFKDAFFVQALQAKGLPVGDVKSDKVLSPEQLTVINMILNFDDVRSHREKLKACGVTSSQYRNWSRQPLFKSYLTKQLWSRFADADTTAITNLLQAVSEGSENALRIFLEMRGHYTKTINVEFNPLQAINRIVEIISRHVDPSTFDAIADEIERLVLTKSSQPLQALPELPTAILEATSVEITQDEEKVLLPIKESLGVNF